MSSEPYIQVYAADMRADPKIQALTRRDRVFPYWLIQAWDIAKNGPGQPDELRAPDGTPLGDRDFADLIPGAAPAKVAAWRKALLELGLADVVDDALHFPTLCKRQGIDRTGAERQRRFRSRHRNGSRNGAVTAHIPEPELEDPLTPSRGGTESDDSGRPRRGRRSNGTSPRQVAERARDVESARRRLANSVEHYRGLDADDREAWLAGLPAELRDEVLAAA